MDDIACPTEVGLDACTICQLRCPLCMNTLGVTKQMPGHGYLKFVDFKSFVDNNPDIKRIDLANKGEIFLNPDLMKIIKYGYRRQKELTADTGVNLNTVNKSVLEGLVRYGFRSMTVSLDGASQSTYGQYRINGDYDRVLANIRTINQYKVKHRAAYPVLTWQFIPFGFNQHAYKKAQKMAHDLGMRFKLQMNTWGYHSWKLTDEEVIKALGASSKESYREKYRHDWNRHSTCLELWRRPQITFDGRMLGCCVNRWVDFGNVFKAGFSAVYRSDKMERARKMLMGVIPGQADLPCFLCHRYGSMKRDMTWISPEDIISACAEYAATTPRK